MAARKFDKSAAFRSIIGAEQPDDDSKDLDSDAVIAPMHSTPEEARPLAVSHRSTPLVTTPSKREARTQRRQVVLTKTLAAAVDAKHKAMGLSFNEAITQLLQIWVEEA